MTVWTYFNLRLAQRPSLLLPKGIAMSVGPDAERKYELSEFAPEAATTSTLKEETFELDAPPSVFKTAQFLLSFSSDTGTVAGERIRGNAEITIDAPGLAATAISLFVQGHIETIKNWTTETGDGNRKRTHHHKQKDSATLYASTVVGKVCDSLSPGHLTIPFDLIVPAEALPTCTFSNVWSNPHGTATITHFVGIQVTPSDRNGVPYTVAKTPFTVTAAPLPPQASRGGPKQGFQREENVEACCCFGGGDIVISGALDQGVYVYGEQVDVALRVENTSTHRVNAVLVQLERRVSAGFDDYLVIFIYAWMQI